MMKRLRYWLSALVLACVQVSFGVTYGVGKVSEFSLSAAMGGGTARVVGVAGLTADGFTSTLYKGNTWDMDGKPPKTNHYYLCFTGDDNLVDAEKDSVYGNKDDFWCSEFTDLNLAYYGGWIPKSQYATVDAAAKALRNTYKADECVTFDWVNGKLTSFGLADKGDVNDYLVWFEGVFSEEEFHSFLAEQFSSAMRLVYLNAFGHAVTCCGYSVGGDDLLNGLFIIDSDNDMFNGGAEKSPNRIMFCPLTVDPDWGLMIANIFAEEWTPLGFAYALMGVDESSDPKAVFDAAGGEVMLSEKTLCLGEPFGELPTPVRTGYSFDGWWNSAYGTVTEDTIVTQSGVVTLGARWQAHAYAVRFDANGGAGQMDDLTGLVYDTQTTLPKCSFVHDDEAMRFRGWALTPEGKVACRDGARVSNLTDEDGALVTLYAVWASAPDGLAFETCETTVEKGGTFVLTVYGGGDEAATSVKVNVSYGSAKAADLDLKQATVAGANGTEKTGLSFPLTLNWAVNDTEPKVITIPTAAGKATDAPKCLVWNLAEAKGLPLYGDTYCIGMIEAGADYAGRDVYVLPFVADAAGGKVSGGASVSSDAKGYKAVTLKATANRGYWFAGWYDAYGCWVSGDPSFKVTPDGDEALSVYEAWFVPEQSALCGTYNGFARVNLRGMTIVKNAKTTADVYGEYAFTATFSTAGKVSGSVTVGGKKVPFKGDSVIYADEDYAMCLVTADEKALFGTANTETLALYMSADGMADLYAWESTDAYAPLGGKNCWGMAYKDVSKDTTESKNLAVFAGTYAGAAVQADGGVVPVSVVVDATGKVKLAGRFGDGSALSATGNLGGYGRFDDDSVTANLELVMTPKALGGGAYHLSVIACAEEAGTPFLLLNGYTTTYTADKVTAAADLYSQTAYPFTAGCWIPTDPELADLDFGAVRLETVDDVVGILYASKNGKITGLGQTLQSGYTVKFDTKTGLFTVTKGKSYTVQGVLGDYAYGCRAAGRFDADGTLSEVSVEYVSLPKPEVSIPWWDVQAGVPVESFLAVGQDFGDSRQAQVTSSGTKLDLTVSGLPSGLKYDKKTGRITGAATKAGTFSVKVSYAFGPQTITYSTSLVVEPMPAGLPTGTYAGFATVRIDDDDRKPLGCPFTATIDKNGALSGSVTLFGKKAAFKAVGYSYSDDGYASYLATLDLKAVDKRWETADFELAFDGDSVVAGTSGAFGTGHVIVGVEALRNQAKDADYATRIAPYANGCHLVSCVTTCGGESAMTVLSVTVDKKGGAKVSGTFVDGTAFSASSALSVSEDGETATALFPVTVKSLGAGGMALGMTFGQDEDGVWCSPSVSAARYSRTDFGYVGYSFPTACSYPYSSRAWVDEKLDPDATCLAVSCSNGAFDEVRFAWATKTVSGKKQITGVGKKLDGSAMTFKLDDKTGLFSGTCGTCKIFGTMDPGTCSGVGTVVDKDGSVGQVEVFAEGL